jgi:hypothetical protein
MYDLICEKYYSALILIPVFLAVLTLLGYGQLYRRGMAVACVLLLLFSPEKNSKKLPGLLPLLIVFRIRRLDVMSSKWHGDTFYLWSSFVWYCSYRVCVFLLG